MSNSGEHIGALRSALIGMAAAVAGLLPWLIGGARLPLQNLWAEDTLPTAMPLVLLPFSQYAIAVIGAVIIVGSALAGAAIRIARARGRHPAVTAVTGGVLLVQLVALVQTVITVRNGLNSSTASTIYLGGLTVGTLLAIAIGAAIMIAIALGPVPLASVAVTAAAIAAAGWFGGLISPFGYPPAALETAIVFVAHGAPALVTGLAIAWSGFGSVGRVVAGIVDLALLWAVPAAVSGLGAAIGSRALAGRLGDMVDMGSAVLRASLGPEGGALPGLILAVVIGVAGAVALPVLRRRAQSTA